MGAWWGGNHPIGWEHSFIHQAFDLLSAVHENRAPEPSIRAGFQVQAVLQAAQVSHAGDPTRQGSTQAAASQS